MTHPLEIENEDLRKRIECTYDECAKIDEELMTYIIFDSLTMENQTTEYMNTILANKQTFNDMMKWGNNK